MLGAPAPARSAYCLFRQRKSDESIESYERALKLDSKLPDAHAGLGAVHMVRFLLDREQTDDRDEAMRHWHRSLELNPDQPRIRELIAKYQPVDKSPEQLLMSD